MCCSLGLRWPLRSGVGAVVVAPALGWWWMLRVTGARRCGRISICRARLAGSPASTRCGWMWVGLMLRRHWRGGGGWGGMGGGAGFGRALKLIKEQLRAVPGNGLGYGLLRYLNAWTGLQLSGFSAPQIGFNYLGRFAGPAGADWGRAAEAVRLGDGGDAAMPLAHCLEVNALTLDGAQGAELTAHWSWAPALVTEAEVRDLAQRWFLALEGLVGHAQAAGAGGRSPSDLPLVALTQGEIERLERQYRQIEDVLPLSPLQEGLLFHALYDAQAADVYTVQLELGLEGALDSAALEAAVDALLLRHASLRAGFWHEGLSRAVQVIVPTVTPCWRRIDLSLLDEASRAQRLASELGQDRGERFDLSCAPLMRFTLIRLSAQQHRLVLT